MDITPILDDLNKKQREAVTAPPNALLILAGAGSGKTRVLTHRIAWLIDVEGLSPHNLLAVTFTNKAATEMKNRVENLLNTSVDRLWIGTFHGLAHRLLRRHWKEAKLTQNFQIIDSRDQIQLIKKVIKNLKLDESKWLAKNIQYFINKQKDEGLRPQDLDDEGQLDRLTQINIYGEYQEICNYSNLVDFAELLLKAYELLQNNSNVLQQYQKQFKYLLVDEFQDTNAIQYKWLKLLAGKKGIPFVVGDDDQSIYRWRGARVEHILQFQNDFPTTSVIKLEQNYRSTGTILEAANAIIANNESRMGKSLWTDDSQGELIKIYAAFNERDEANFIINRLIDWNSMGNPRSEVAILYRSNAQSRVLEETLVNKNIPYRVFGGLRFFERAEIKDALAYLRLAVNQNDDSAFERIVNKPTRGIGARTLEILRQYAKNHNCSMWEAIKGIADKKSHARSNASMLGFITLIERINREITDLSLHNKVDYVISQSGLITLFQKEKNQTGEARIENLKELVSAARSFTYNLNDEISQTDAFLSQAALEAGEGQAEEWEDCVQLMTMHAAKGLEFQLVFISGMEDGLVPHQRSINDSSGVEEERRLCYVAITRAKQNLFITYAEQRRLHGVDIFSPPSRFISEIPDNLIEPIKSTALTYRSKSLSLPSKNQKENYTSGSQRSIKLGQLVRHTKFGDGIILAYEGEGAHARVHVNFESVGTKWLVLSYANLDLL